MKITELPAANAYADQLKSLRNLRRQLKGAQTYKLGNLQISASSLLLAVEEEIRQICLLLEAFGVEIVAEKE